MFIPIKMSAKKVFIVGISGASNSGKTTLTAKLVKHFGQKIIRKAVSQDFYFYDPGDEHHVKVPELGVDNYEVLTSLDMDKMVVDVNEIKEKYQQQPGNNISIILIEGFTIYGFKPLNDLFDVKYFLTISEDNCRERRSHRHYIPADIPGYFDKVVWPAYKQYLQLVKLQNDIVYLDGEKNQDLAFQRVASDLENIYSASLNSLT